MIDYSNLDEYSLERIKRLAAEAQKTYDNINDLILGMQALIICRGEDLKKAPEAYEIIKDFINAWPNIKAKRRYLAAIDKLKGENCNEGSN